MSGIRSIAGISPPPSLAATPATSNSDHRTDAPVPATLRHLVGPATSHPATETSPANAAGVPVSPAAGSFTEILGGTLSDVNQMQSGADLAVQKMLTGEQVSQAEVLTAVQKADLAFRTMLQIRNKLVEAYRDLQQIQI
ncbi:MAG: flagellar hook-basal body complex protein FliE [Planctomycetota bacterium]